MLKEKVKVEEEEEEVKRKWSVSGKNEWEI